MTEERKVGFQDTLAPEVVAEMEYLWVKTTVARDEIAERLNAKHGTAFKVQNIEWHARRRGWTRDQMARSVNRASHIEERLATKSLLRSNRIPCEDNPIRLVKPGTHKASGFRLGMSE